MIALLMLPLLFKVFASCFQAAALCFQLLNLDGKLSICCIGLCNACLLLLLKNSKGRLCMSDARYMRWSQVKTPWLAIQQDDDHHKMWCMGTLAINLPPSTSAARPSLMPGRCLPMYLATYKVLMLALQVVQLA